MSGFCGWFGELAEGSASARLAAMRAGLAAAPAEVGADRAAGFGALAARGETAGVHAGDGLLVALDGVPRFQSGSRFAELASQAGAPAALAAAYRELGTDCLEAVRGPFALAILDRDRQQALLAIDRMGIHGLVHAEVPGGLVFATSAEALRRHPAVRGEVGANAIYRYLVNDVSPAPFTMYDGVHKLLPAHRLVYRRASGGEAAAYWRIPYGQAGADGRSFDSLREELFHRLETAARRAAAMAPTGGHGAFLSGGLDSSAVCGVLRERVSDDLQAFTVGFDDPRYDESLYARAAARHFDIPHHRHALRPEEVLALLPRLARTFDEPFANSSVIPAYYCARLAREQGTRLMFAGDGGDEIFGGNKRYAEQNILQAYFRVPALARRMAEPALAAWPEALSVSLVGKARRYVQRAAMAMPERMLFSRLYTRERLAEVFSDDALAEIDVEAPFALWARHYREAAGDHMVYAMLHLDTRTALADNDLRKVRAACAMAGVPVAFPLLDEDLVAFAAGLRPEQLVRGTQLRHFFRRAMQGYLPRQVLSKSKHGFGMPFAEWTRDHGELHAFATACLERLKRRGFLRPSFIDTVRAQHGRTEATPYDGVVWDLMMLELWFETRAEADAMAA